MRIRQGNEQQRILMKSVAKSDLAEMVRKDLDKVNGSIQE
jgi:hypothetical protein